MQSLEQAQRAAVAAAAADRDAAAAPASSDRQTDGAAQPGAVQHVFRTLEQGEQRFEGTLQNIECSGRAVVFHVTTSDGPMVARAPTMAQVEFITYREDLSGKIGCGTLKQPMRST